MISFIREGDEVWDVPVVVYCVWTVVLLVSSLILLSCLARETNKFNKKISRTNTKVERLPDLQNLESILSRYVRGKLGLGVLTSLANSFDDPTTSDQAIRLEIEEWFSSTVNHLKLSNYNDKTIKRKVLAALRGCLVKHPLDLRGSRLALEAARIFLQMEDRKEKVSFLSANLTLPKGEVNLESQRSVCPTIFCDWVANGTLKCLSMTISHRNTTPLLFAFLSFCVWLYDTVTDMAIIDELWNFNLPIMYPSSELEGGEITYLSYQTLTIDLYAPLLLLFLVFSLTFTLLSCSCSRLNDKYRLATEYNRPEREVPGQHIQHPTSILSRYDFNILSSVTSSLPQFCLQFSAYIIILYMLETLKGLSVDQATKDQIDDKIQNFSFTSLWMSGVGSGLALVVAQYTAFKIQHEHGLTLSQRVVYMVACMLNTISMMCSCLVLVVVVLLPAATYVGRYHIMVILILGASVLGIGFLISAVLAGFGLDPTKVRADRISTRLSVEGVLTSFLAFTRTGEGKWRTILGATTLIGRIFSLMTVNLFLPPSQLLAHPFLKFYSTSPRSPALHYAIAKQIIYYNIITLISAIVLCIDIQEYGFNYNITQTTKNLLVYANVCGVPCLFISLSILFKFYTRFDLWTSNGVHLVYIQDFDGDESRLDCTNGPETTTYSILDDTLVSAEDTAPINQDEEKSSGEEQDEKIREDKKEAEEENDCVEADRINVVKKHSKVLLRKQKERLNKRLQGSCFGDCLVDIAEVDTQGSWIDLSDHPIHADQI